MIVKKEVITLDDVLDVYSLLCDYPRINLQIEFLRHKPLDEVLLILFSALNEAREGESKKKNKK